MDIISFVRQPWHWSISGLMIVVVMLLLLWFGGSFGFSSNLRTLCAIGGAGKKVSFFDFNWKAQRWNLVFAVGSIIGGAIAINFFPSPEPVQIAESTQSYLQSVGIETVGSTEYGAGFVPGSLFNFENLATLKGFIFLIIGGFCIGFGTRWAGGCTSGHAISGLANLQIPSLIAVVGFFIGGLVMTHLLMPYLLAW